MSLRNQAAADLVTILEDDVAGFGWVITVTDPDGTSAALKGFSTDIGTTIDPETGMAIVGRQASVALPISKLTEAGLAVPRAIHDACMKPWVVVFDDIEGVSHTFKVREAMPDTAVGVVTCILEVYRP